MENREFLLSYIVPAYNAEYVLEPCINSIIQIGRDVEVIIVNDGSTDCTGNIAQKLCDKYPNQIKVINQKNQGVSAARNIGIGTAHGKYIAFSDADDTINTEKVRGFLSENIMIEDIIMLNYTVVENGKRKIRPLFSDLYSDNPKDSLLKHLLYCKFSRNDEDKVLGGKVFQYFWEKNYLIKNRIWFNTTLSYAEDLVFCCLAVKRAKTIRVVDESIYDYYVTKGTASRCYRENYWNELQRVYDALNKICPEYIDQGMYFYYARTALFHISEYTLSKTISRDIALDKFCEVLSDKRVHDDFISIKKRCWTLREKTFNALMNFSDNGRALFYYLFLTKKIRARLLGLASGKTNKNRI